VAAQVAEKEPALKNQKAPQIASGRRREEKKTRVDRNPKRPAGPISDRQEKGGY
jgi:hypothetical protein